MKLTQNVQLIQAAIKTHAKVEDHCDLQCEYLHYQKSSYERLQWATKLPDNLKQFFRPVAISVPGNELIAKVMMFVEGFRAQRSWHNALWRCPYCRGSCFQCSNPTNVRLLKLILSLPGRLLQDHKRKHDGQGPFFLGTWTTTPESNLMVC